MTLKSLTPEDAIEEYLKSREHDASKSTLQNHRYRLKQFRLWTDEQDIADMNEMTGRKAEQFKNWRISSCDINAVTLENHLVFHLAYHTGLRRGALYALVLEDSRSGDRILEVRHRDYTPLNFADEGERDLSLTDDRLVTALNDYVTDVLARSDG